MMWWSTKKSAGKAGLLVDGCDYHSHLLPGVDDGVQTLETSLQILNYMEELGLQKLWLTPHIMEDIPNTAMALKERFQVLTDAYHGSITLNLAAEYMMDNLFEERWKARDLLTINDRYLLLETTYIQPPIHMVRLLDDVLRQGIFPVLAHPERYQYMQPADYKKWKERRVCFQLNLPSLTGMYGRAVQDKAEYLLEEGIYDICGSDTHSLRMIKVWVEHSSLSSRVIKQLLPLMQKQLP